MASMAFSSNGKFLAVLCRTGRVDVWDVSSDTLIATTDAIDASETGSVVFCPDKETVVITGYCRIRYWNPQKEKLNIIEWPELIDPDRRFNENLGDGLSPSQGNEFGYPPLTTVSQDCKLAASVTKDGMIYIWDIKTGNIEQKLTGSSISDQPMGGIEKLIFSANKKLLASGSRRGVVELYRLRD
jgi:WD40 repeat protein